MAKSNLGTFIPVFSIIFQPVDYYGLIILTLPENTVVVLLKAS